MACCASNIVTVFDHAWLSTRSGYAATSTSGAVPAAGNKVVLSVTVINISASSTFTLYIDGSYDGKTWAELTSGTQSSFGYATVAQASLATGFVRVRAVLAGTTVDALFAVSLAFSSQ